jgi:gliding motility-associated-like protein
MQKIKIIRICFLLIVLPVMNQVDAQTCIADYFSINYKGETQQTINKVLTANNEIILAGNIHQGFNLEADGFLCKLTPYGTVVWSKKFIAPPGYNFLTFSDVASLPDGGFFVAGSIVKYVNGYNMKGWGILLKIDKYGNLVWAKTMSLYDDVEFITSFTNIFSTNDGEYIIHGFFIKIIDVTATSNRVARGPTFFIRIDKNGNIRWRSQFSMEAYTSGLPGTGFKQLQNGNLIFGMNLHEQLLSGPDVGKLINESYYLLDLDYNTGKRIWDKMYLYPSTQTYASTSIGPVKHITELPNGDLSFLFSFSDSVRHSPSPYTKRSANMITTPDGALKKVLGYYNMQIGCYTSDAIDGGANGEQIVLMYDGNKPLLISLDKDGQIVWQKAYDPGSSYVPQSLLNTPYGYYIISNKLNEGTFNLIKTDTTANMACLSSSINMVTEDVSRMFENKDVNILHYASSEYFAPVNVANISYSLNAATLCKETCCIDTLDTTNSKNIVLCEGNTYTLPDNYMVKDPGIYNVVYKTQKGCDSIVPYYVNVLKNPASLSLGNDTCLEERDSIVLKATAGFASYNWLNTIRNDSTFLVTQPGKYWVEVSNSCGTKRDSIEVFKNCDFEIYLPNAFTPNGDGLNDYFGVPGLNKIRLIKLTVYNRWGQLIFETNDINNRWDGRYKKSLQPVGIYIYYVEMENLNGKRITKKGFVTLIR